jgi:hypothetical protein
LPIKLLVVLYQFYNEAFEITETLILISFQKT